MLSAFGYVASSPQIYEPSLMIVVQGSKVACTGPRTFEYGTGHYLIRALSVPFKCETFATPEKPLYGVSVAIDRVLLGELVQAMGPVTGHESQVQTPESMTSVRIDNTMRDSVERLLRCLHDPLECQAMGGHGFASAVHRAARTAVGGVACAGRTAGAVRTNCFGGDLPA